MKKILICLVCFLLYTGSLFSQSIRKDHREMIQLERDAFVNALYSESALIQNFGNFHNSNFPIIHFRSTTINIPTNYDPAEDIFLPWHRYMIFELEQELQNHCKCLSIPYWYWVNDNLTTSSLWDEDFMGQFDTDPAWGITRDLGYGGSNTLPNLSEIITIQNIPSFYDTPGYSNQLETGKPHVGGHSWVGGFNETMSSGESPKDPIFYLHHNMIDKLWHEWEEVNGNSSFNRTNMVRYDGNYNGRPDNITLPSVNPNDIIDSRSLGVFFAEDMNVVLDKYSVSNDYKNPETFYYQYRIGIENNFTVPTGKVAEVYSENEIELLPGFEAENGSDVLIAINDNDCGFQNYGRVIKDGIVTANKNARQNVYSQSRTRNLEVTLKLGINQIGDVLELTGDTEDLKMIAIYDVSGKQVKNFSPSLTMLDISDLRTGIYSLFVLNVEGKRYGELIHID